MGSRFSSFRRALRTGMAVALVGAGFAGVPATAQEATPPPPGRQDVQAVVESYQFADRRQQSLAGLQSELEALAARRRAMQSEEAYIGAKISWAQRKLAGRGAPDGQDATYAAEQDKWMREVKAWEARMAEHKEGLNKVMGEEQALMKALGEVARSRVESDMLVPGETIEVYVAEDDSFSGIYQVRAGGYILLPRLPKIFVAGKTIQDVENSIREELGKNQLKDATVTVDRIQGTVEAIPDTREIIYLAGQVTTPGPWPVPKDFQPTVVTVLLRVGLTYFADLTRVQVLRLVDGRGLVEEVDVQRIMQGQGLTPDIALRANDIVIVPARETGEHDKAYTTRKEHHRIYVQGNVVTPGVVELVPPARMTVLAAVRQSGGPNRNADLGNLELIRIERDRTLRETIDLGAIMRREIPDVNLLAEDILVLYGLDARRILAPVRVYLTGTVKKVGPVEIKGEEGQLTLLQALLHNGGFARFAKLSGVYVLRDMGNGVRNRIPVDVKKVQQGIIPDLIMKDNDVVVVPERFFSF